MSELTGKVVAITGATAGIGRATARAVVAEGASAVVGGRRRQRLDELEAELGEAVLGVEMDVRDPDASRRMVDAAVERYGKLDVMVANAGIGAYGGIMDLTDEKLADHDGYQCRRNGLADPCGRASLLRDGRGRHRHRGFRRWATWCAVMRRSMRQRSLLRWVWPGGLDRELRDKNIRVSTICPGGTATEFAMGAGRTPDMPGLADMMRPENIADAVVTVLSQPATMRTLVWSMRSTQEPD